MQPQTEPLIIPNNGAMAAVQPNWQGKAISQIIGTGCTFAYAWKFYPERSDNWPEKWEYTNSPETTFAAEDVGRGLWISAKDCSIQPETQASSNGLHPNIFILEDDGTYPKDFLSILRKFYEKYPDSYDFLALYVKNSERPTSGFVLYYDTKGGFYPPKDIRSSIGSKRLLGSYLIPVGQSFAGPIGYIPSKNPMDLIDYYYFKISFHELSHAFGEVTLPEELIDVQELNADGIHYDRSHFESGVGSFVAADASTRAKNVEINGK